MRKILISLGMIVFVGAVVAGATGAFFSDTETSTGNTFAAGAIDLGIDNESYYNGALNQGTSWSLNFDLDKGCRNPAFPGTNPDTQQPEPEFIPCLFFNFDDVKPGDYGEDTISIHVNDNESWLCADVSLDSDDDVTCTEPENDSDAENGACQDSDTNPTDGVGDNGNNADGDLADSLNFLWWADDGDNVLEDHEQTLPAGPIGALSVGATTTVTLADSLYNIWTGQSGPFPAGDTRYIGKAWCFGPIQASPLSQSSLPQGRPTTTPAQDGSGNRVSGEPADGGYLCDGESVGNEAQTDKAKISIAFRAIQSRNNGLFQCKPELFPLDVD